MKFNVIVAIVFSAFAFSVSNAQTKPAKPAVPATAPATAAAPTDTTPFELKVYDKAMLFGDLMVAKQEIFQLLTKYPDNLGYMDSLARIYFSLNAYPQALLASRIILEKQPQNPAMLELSAISYDALGSKKDALETYEKLYPITKSLSHKYQIALLQYSMQRNGECNQSIDVIMNDPKSEQEKITINIDQEHQQEVPVKAAVLNLRGVMLKDAKENDKAKETFEEALKIYPDFVLPKANLEMMKKDAEAPKESTDKKNEKKK